MSWIQAVAAIGGSLLQGAANSSASKSQAKGAEAAAATQRYMYDTTRRDYQPYLQSGYGALNEINRQLGLPAVQMPGTGGFAEEYNWTQSGKLNDYEVVRAFEEFMGRRPTDNELKYFTKRERANQLYNDLVLPGLQKRRQEQQQTATAAGGEEEDPYGAFRASPGYQWRVDEADRAFERQRNRTGSLYSGAALREAARYSQGLADQEYSDYYNRLAGVAGIGKTATNQVAGYGVNYAANIGSSQLYSGAARASGVLGWAGAGAGALSGAADLYDAWNRRRGSYGGPTDYAEGYS